MNNKLEELRKEIKFNIDKLNKELQKEYNGKQAIVPHGKHKGRLGIIKNTHYSDGYIICLLPPFNKKNKNEVLWDNPSRTYIDLSEIEDTIID